MKKVILLLIPLLVFQAVESVPAKKMGEWKVLDQGLSLAQFPPSEKSKIGAYPIVILRIDPRSYSFRLMSASEQGKRERTAKQWCQDFGLIAAINASMYSRQDPQRSTGFMKNYNYMNNNKINPSFGAFMMFNPMDSSLPPVQIMDSRSGKDWRDLMDRYQSVVQNYRMVNKGKGVRGGLSRKRSTAQPP